MAVSAAVAGDEDDRDARVDPADLLEDVQAGLVGQAQVEEDDVGRVGADALEPLRAGAGDLDPVQRRRGTPGAPAPGSGPGRRR